MTHSANIPSHPTKHYIKMPTLLLGRDGSLNTNPPVGNSYALTDHGTDWLWAVFAVYLFSLLIVVALSYFVKGGEPIFHYLFIISLFSGVVSYFAIASGLGSTPVRTSTNSPGTRQIFFAMYINWYVSLCRVILYMMA